MEQSHRQPPPHARKASSDSILLASAITCKIYDAMAVDDPNHIKHLQQSTVLHHDSSFLVLARSSAELLPVMLVFEARFRCQDSLHYFVAGATIAFEDMSTYSQPLTPHPCITRLSRAHLHSLIGRRHPNMRNLGLLSNAPFELYRCSSQAEAS